MESQYRCHVEDQRICSICGRRRALKDYHTVRFKSLFGRIDLRVPRLFGCACAGQHDHAQTVRIDGLINWISPELEFIQSQLAAAIPYARTTDLLELLLPVADGNTPSTVRRHTLGIGQRLDALLQEPIDTLAIAQTQTDPVTVVGLDSGYVRDYRSRSASSFEIVVGRILSKNKGSRSLGFVRTLECDRVAGERLKQRLREYGTTTETVHSHDRWRYRTQGFNTLCYT